jgi:nitrogen fixation/metabolism regulation signal transduction histidine kinase|tara:strand:+ start:162 stop:1508 length:1347 start_codon:yes stop_codon:yes gene_type:complete
MGFKRFSVLLAVRLLVIMLALAVLAYLATSPGYYAAKLLVLIVTLTLGWEIFRFVSKTNQEVSRFLDAARYADFGQRFELGPVGAGFTELGETFTAIMERFRDDRAIQESDLRHLKALVEHVPVPLMSIHGDQVSLWNNAARRLFGIAQVTRVADLAQFGAEFSNEVTTMRAGDKRLVTFVTDNMEQSLAIAATEITIAASTERLISLQNIQQELDGTQLDAWQDLVRVLTHEILNSITPVASLARTAADLVDDALQRGDDAHVGDELADVKDAVTTVARRSDALMNFVSSYRQLTRLPAPEKSQFQLNELFTEVTSLVTSEWEDMDLELATSVEPRELDVIADREMLERILINILQNAQQALVESKSGQVGLSARLNKRGHVTIEIADNGPGIAQDIERKIFIPFFTTKREGSGVGLALSRQVMISHGSSISVSRSETGGACFTLVF